MPTRSPIPSTDTSTCVAPAEIASYAFAMAQPVSLWAWKPMSHLTALRSSRTSTKTWRGVAMPTVSAIPIRWTPSFSAAWWTDEVLHLRAEGVLGGEADLEPRRERELDGRGHRVDDLLDRLPVGGLAEDAARREEEPDAAHAGVERRADVVEHAARVGDDARAEPELHDLSGVPLRLRRGGRGGHLDVLDAEGVERPRDLELVLGAEVGPGELLALAQRRVDELPGGLGHRASSRARAGRRSPAACPSSRASAM